MAKKIMLRLSVMTVVVGMALSVMGCLTVPLPYEERMEKQSVSTSRDQTNLFGTTTGSVAISQERDVMMYRIQPEQKMELDKANLDIIKSVGYFMFSPIVVILDGIAALTIKEERLVSDYYITTDRETDVKNPWKRQKPVTQMGIITYFVMKIKLKKGK